MNVTCPHCQTKLNVPDEKIPQDRDSFLKCPKCSERIKVPASQAGALDPSDPGEFRSGSRPSSGRGRAMVCLGEGTPASVLAAALGQMEFEAEISKNILQALKKMEYHVYPLVLIDETFDQGRGLSELLAHMNDLDMSVRRRICLILLSRRISSTDRMAALHASVNHIIGAGDMAHLSDILSQALAEHEKFYIVYNESMKAAGKA